MAAPVNLTAEEAKDFLTKSDLQKLEGLVSEAKLKAMIDEARSPYIVVRGKYIRLFDALEIMGTL